MGSYQDPVQGAVVFAVAMMGTLLNGTLDALICMAVHNVILLFIWYGNSMIRFCHINPDSFFQ